MDWRLVLVSASVLMGVLESISAFIIEFPAAAVGAVVIFWGGAYWLTRGARKPVVLVLGALHLLELVFGIAFLGKPADETGGLAILIPVIIISAGGVVAAWKTLKARGSATSLGA